MKRQVEQLESREFDLVVVGGGIFGACAAWDAALRGLSVVLLEAYDFGSGVSANSFRMVHGGIRYIQHLDFPRVRSSCHERTALLRTAPHLVAPLPIAIPTYGHLLEGKEFLACGMYLYDLVTADRNRRIADPERQIPWTRLLGKSEIQEMFPGLPEERLTGGTLFCDAQMYNPTRLVWAFIASAIGQGAVAVNHVSADEFIVEKGKVVGVSATDALTGDKYRIRSRMVLNTAGPWSGWLLKNSNMQLPGRVPYSRDACFIVPRRFPHAAALAIQGGTKDPDAKFSRPARHMFVVPWREYSLIGVWHVVTEVHPEKIDVTDEELESFIKEMNECYPALELRQDEVKIWNAGLVPFGENAPGAKDLKYGHRSHLVDHAKTDGLEGLITLIGIRYTMGRGDAERAVSLACRHLGHSARVPDTLGTPVYGGDIPHFTEFMEAARARHQGKLSTEVIDALARNHGTRFEAVLDVGEQAGLGWEPIPGTRTLPAEIVYVARDEMACKLSDVIFTRTDMAAAEDPGADAIATAADLVARELGWSAERRAAELEDVAQRLRHRR
jgi:glycerol-3-phosphate dehydrogenase